MDERIPLTPVEGSTWEPERSEQETSFRGLSGMRARLNAGFVEDKVNGLYEVLSKHFTGTRTEFIMTILNQYMGNCISRVEMNPQ